MPILLFLIFVAVPLAEIAIFIYVGDLIGVAATIALVIVTAFIGTALLRLQGLSVLARTQDALGEGRIPVDSVIDGVFLLIAGAFLLTPGLLTDSVGFLLFVPFLRRGLARWIFQKLINSENVSFTMFGTRPNSGHDHGKEPPAGGDGPIIDGEYRPINADEHMKSETEPGHNPKSSDRNSPWRR